MIQDSAVLVDLNISVWTGRKMDKRVSEQVDASNNTKTRAGNYHKKLLAGTEALDALHAVAGNMRQWHYENTLPWNDNGSRLLPMSNFFEYKAMLNQFQQQFQNAVDGFISQYDDLVSAAAFTLGDLFNPNDYPTVDQIRNKNSMRVVFSPVPTAGDFRVDIPNEYREELQKISEERVNAAMKDAWDRLHTCLKHMSDKLAGTEKQVFRDSLVNNATDLCSMLTKLNVTNDPKLEQARQELERALVGIDAKELRKNDDIRKDVKARVDEILGMF
jgi:hypothetical protein